MLLQHARLASPLEKKKNGSWIAAHLRSMIKRAGGWIPFDLWMNEALYAPDLGYYTSSTCKLGKTVSEGDFTTAPELTPLFGSTLAHQVIQVLSLTGTQDILEFGAGTGSLAESLLKTLPNFGFNVNYYILELSPYLRCEQQHRLSQYSPQVQWLETTPDCFNGCILANEVLDAMPVSLIHLDKLGKVLECGVSLGKNELFVWKNQPAGHKLVETVKARIPPFLEYTSEINLRAEKCLESLGSWFKSGAALIIDYGFPRHEYYHAERRNGTLMCHLRHHALSDPLFAPGLQDITAHIDFSAMATAARRCGLDLLGYTTLANFLINSGIVELLNEVYYSKRNAFINTAAHAQRLLSESEMGELFKVIAIGKGLKESLIGFKVGDRSSTL